MRGSMGTLSAKLRLPRGSLLRAQSAYTVIELMVTLAIFFAVAKIAVSYFEPKRMQIVAAQRLLIGNLRVARANAITRSVHFQVALKTASQIKISQMQETPAGSGNWQVSTANVQTITLPSATQIKSTEVGTTVEFGTRGWACFATSSTTCTVGTITAPLQIDAQDSFGQTKSLQIWSSGQVNAL
jgi:Tfp pilus assembly protein FimT